MSDNASNSSNVTVSVPRNALLAAGGAALVGIGIAAGVMFKGHSDAKPEAAEAAASAASVVVASAPTEAASATAEAPASTAEQQAQASAPAKEVAAAEPAPKKEATKEAKKAKAKHPAADASPATAAGTTPQVVEQARVVCATCGTVESVNAVRKQGQGSGLGAVAGGVLGGIVGNQMGKGDGKTAMTVLGAIGGGMAGNAIEKNQRSTTVYEVTIRMDDGSTRVVTENSPPAVGARVDLSGQGQAPSAQPTQGNGNAGTMDLRP